MIHRRRLLAGATALLASPAVITSAQAQQRIALPTDITSGGQTTVTRVATARPVVALTFDDGPHPSLTAQLMDIMAARGVRAREGALGPANLQASVLLPMGRDGPAFLAYPNFEVYFDWNKSFVYVTTAAYFATRLGGAAVYDAGNPTPALSGQQMQQLQQKLTQRGHDVGGIDGILGAMTRAAVQAEQIRLGMPADAWPTIDLLNRL